MFLGYSIKGKLLRWAENAQNSATNAFSGKLHVPPTCRRYGLLWSEVCPMKIISQVLRARDLRPLRV